VKPRLRTYRSATDLASEPADPTDVATLVVVVDGAMVQLVVTALGSVVARVVGADVEGTVGRDAAAGFEWVRVHALPTRSAKTIPKAVAMLPERFIEIPHSAA
jgi:hypothetical protein